MWPLALLALFACGEGVAPAPAPPPARPQPHWVTRTDDQLAEVLAATCAASVADGRPVLVEFSAPWCVDCKALHAVEADPALASEYGNWHRVRVDVGRFERHHAVMEAFGVRAIAHWTALRPIDCAAPASEWPRLDARLVELASGQARADGVAGLVAWLGSARGGAR